MTDKKSGRINLSVLPVVRMKISRSRGITNIKRCIPNLQDALQALFLGKFFISDQLKVPLSISADKLLRKTRNKLKSKPIRPRASPQKQTSSPPAHNHFHMEFNNYLMLQ
jgi:hypothetical protein